MAAMPAALLARLWSEGVFRGQAAELEQEALRHGTHPRANELRAFADIAVLLEGQAGRLPAPGTYLADPAHAPCARALGHAAIVWRTAAIGDLTRGRIAAERLEAALAQADAEQPVDPRRAGARAFAQLALAELAVIDGQEAQARGRLQELIVGRAAPSGCALAARSRMAMLLGQERPQAGVRAFDGVAATAELLQQPFERLHALTYAGLFSLSAGDSAGAEQRFARVVATDPPDAARRYATLARLLLAILGEGIQDDTFAHIAEGIRLAAADGDPWGYTVLIGFAARCYVERGQAADALITVSAGIEQLRRAGGEQLALPLIVEREAVRHELGEERYQDAARAAVAQLNADPLG